MNRQPNRQDLAILFRLGVFVRLSGPRQLTLAEPTALLYERLSDRERLGSRGTLRAW
jgi:hypothetical protein